MTRLLAVTLLAACGSTAAQQPSPHLGDSLIAKRRHPDAPAELEQYGKLVGTWTCRAQSRQKDGSFKATPFPPATWTFFYTLGGYAIADVFQPGKPGSAPGMNVRIYDPEQKRWRMVWWRHPQSSFDRFEATYKDGTIIMTGDRPARSKFKAHRARITFHSMTASSFEWRYEAAAPGGTKWLEFQRISCKR